MPDACATSIARATPERHAADTRAIRSPPSTVRSLRVLLIDDDPTLIESLRSALVDEGHKVSTANGGQAGIDAFRAARAAACRSTS